MMSHRGSKGSSQAAISASIGRVVPRGRARKSHNRATATRTGTVQKRLGRVRIHPLDGGSLRILVNVVLISEQLM